MKKESTKLRFLRAYVLKCQRVLRAYVPWVPTYFACLRANMSCVLTCQCVLGAHVPTCLRAHVLKLQITEKFSMTSFT